MIIKQFEDKNLAHFSYAILSEGKIGLIDPARNPQQYYDFSKQHNAEIVAVIETHPHADFVSSHLEIHNTTGAIIYVSKLLGAKYPHQVFDDGAVLQLGNVKLKSMNTPGHSPDSISIVLENEEGNDYAVFTGDTLFIGDCGRPDLRENAGNVTAKREQLAKSMYHSLREKLMLLNDEVLVYPTHGAGSLCGKGLSNATSSTIGKEKLSNWSLQKTSEDAFIKALTEGQPFIPKYFGFDVEMNRNGADNYQQSILKVVMREPVTCQGCAKSLGNILIIDTRPQQLFKQGHLKGSINLMNDTKFETWLGSIVSPNEKFHLIAENENQLRELISRITKIGYEKFIEQAFVLYHYNATSEQADVKHFSENIGNYTIIDIRNEEEAAEKIFENSIQIPLHQLRERTNEIPRGKPIMVHCAGGYRSAAGSSIIKNALGENVQVFDLSEAIKTFKENAIH